MDARDAEVFESFVTPLESVFRDDPDAFKEYVPVDKDILYVHICTLTS